MSVKWEKGFLPVVSVLLLTVMLVSCQSASEEPHQDKSSTTTAGAPSASVSRNSTLELTPIEDLGITGEPQDVDINEYRLAIDGLVEKPLSLSYQDILAYPPVTEIGIINCPGYFRDIAEWTGVPLKTIFTEAGLKPGAVQATFYSLDGYKSTLSLEHINKHDVFLAYKVNGETLPREHGYPLRLVDKGSDGYAWVKWLERIEVG